MNDTYSIAKAKYNSYQDLYRTLHNTITKLVKSRNVKTIHSEYEFVISWQYSKKQPVIKCINKKGSRYRCIKDIDDAEFKLLFLSAIECIDLFNTVENELNILYRKRNFYSCKGEYIGMIERISLNSETVTSILNGRMYNFSVEQTSMLYWE